MYILKTHCDFDLLQALPQADEVVSYCKELGYAGCALTCTNLSGVPTFIKTGKKENLKAIAGLQVYTGQGFITILTKNKAGWKDLIKLASHSNLSENFKGQPTIELKGLSYDNFFVYEGYFGSDLFNGFYSDWKRAWEQDYDGAKSLVKPTWEKDLVSRIEQYRESFGKKNVYVGVQLNNKEVAAAEIFAKALRYISKKYDIPKIWVHDSHYLRKEDAFDHRVLVCIGAKTKLSRAEADLRQQGRQDLLRYFQTNNYHIPTQEEVRELYTQDEIDNANFIGETCESYDIAERPKLPKFSEDSDGLLKKLCFKGWKEKIIGTVPPEKHPIYAERVKSELEVIKGTAILADYFLVVQDYCNWFKGHGWWMGPSRGSAGGCLVSHLINITDLDPLEYDLSFERFYNAGRNTKDRVKLPDIDSDFPKYKRERVIEYIKGKWGEKRVCQMATYHRLQGRAVLKDVLRVHDKCSFDEVNRITKFIPDESKISDKLQEMQEEFGESSIILWALKNNAKGLQEWVKLKEGGTCEGELGLYFEQAMRLEGRRKVQSKHASGIIISPVDLVDHAPMIMDKVSGNLILGLEMEDAEECGWPKYDILGLETLDRCEAIEGFIRTGDVVWPT